MENRVATLVRDLRDIDIAVEEGLDKWVLSNNEHHRREDVSTRLQSLNDAHKNLQTERSEGRKKHKDDVKGYCFIACVLASSSMSPIRDKFPDSTDTV